MMRNASRTDFQFIFNLALAEAKNGHFFLELLNPAASFGFALELDSILAKRVRPNGIQAYALIWQRDSKPIGFIIMSAGSDMKGNELWMSALSPEYRGNGEGTKMVNEILVQFRGKNRVLWARCAPESKAMFQILTTNGFSHELTDKNGTRGLLYNL